MWKKELADLPKTEGDTTNNRQEGKKMSKHDEIAAIVEKYCGELADYDLNYNNKRCWVFYSYKTFPSDKKSNLLKFDKNLF